MTEETKSWRKKRKGVELIAFDNNHNLEFPESCKLTINFLSNTLTAEPKNEEYKMKTALFKQTFFAQKNILFIFDENGLTDFALIFAKAEVCKKILDLINGQKKEQKSVTEEMLAERFLIPIFKKINDKNFTKMKEIIEDWILRHDKINQEKYYKLMNKYSEESNSDDNIATVTQEIQSFQSLRIRKRRHHERIDSANRYSMRSKEKSGLQKMSSKKRVAVEYSKTIYSALFKMVTIKVKCGIQRRLIIFTSAEKEMCYEYTCKNQIYFCSGCSKHRRKRITAIMGYDDDKNEECVKLINKPHICKPIPYEAEKYAEIITLKKPGYEFFDNCSTPSRRILFVFHPSNPNLCYKYFWKTLEDKFYCRGCHLKKKDTTAEIFNENKENECIRLLHTDHICEYINFEPEKYTQFNNFVLKPDFEIHTKISSRYKKLIIFDKNDRSLCYIYFHKRGKNYFVCGKCHDQNKTVFAKIYQNSEGEEYIILSNVSHVCTPQKYIPQTKEIILRPPKIKFEMTKVGHKIVYIYTSDDQSQCYLFKSVRKDENRLGCKGCTNLLKSKNRKRKPDEIVAEKVVYAYLFKEDDNSEADDYFIRMIPDQKHICKPQKTSITETVPVTIQSNDYFLYQQKLKKKELLYLGIYLKEDRKLCYKYCFDTKGKVFVCNACGSHENRVRVTAKIQQDSEGNEFIISSGNKHNCKPIKVSTIKQLKGIKILEKSGLSFAEPIKKKKSFNEDRILKLPNFELHRSITGIKDGKLVVFKKDDKNLCYNYFFNKHDSCFLCAKCSKKKNRVRADLHIDEETGEKFIELGKNEHSCEAVKYEPEKDIIEESNFLVVNRESKIKPTKLIVFTSDSKEFCYEYVLRKAKHIFTCYACEMKKLNVSVQIHKNEDGHEFVQTHKNEHICQPKKFEKEKYQLKILPKSEFFLCTNKLGKINAKMVIFDQNKKGFCYEYHLKGDRNLFLCTKCYTQHQHNTTAKLSKDGEFLELSSTQHLCKSIEFNAEKYEDNEILSDDKFSLLPGYSGEPLLKLTIFDPRDKNYGYEYYYAKVHNVFYCCGCQNAKPEKHVAAKLLTDENGKHSIELKKQKHVCKIRNLKEMHKIFEADKFKKEENDKMITVKHPTEKNSCYKFTFDNEMNAFCCIECKSKDTYLIATFCKDKNEKEFLILNGSHCCLSLRKHV